MSNQATTPPAPPGLLVDERLRPSSRLTRLLGRPELGALAGTIAVWIFFAVVAGSAFLTASATNAYLEVAAEIGILAVPVSLLMIGGEFDLSIGAIIAATGMITALLAGTYGYPFWFGIGAAALFALVVGFLNGLIVVWTRLPSFIVTLGTQFILVGVTIGMTRHLTGLTTIGQLNVSGGFSPAHAIFATKLGGTYAVSILWWIAIVALATWILLRTRFGNWTFGAGGSADAARNLGVPVARVKIVLFMCTALAAWLVASIEATSFNNSDVLRGTGREFEAIIAAVIGGTLLTGGYGSVVGPALGALIFGMVAQGIVIVGVDSDWYKAFLGGMLIVAVLINNYIRRRVGERR